MSRLELVVLGSAGSHTGPGRVCSGYLVRSATTSLLVDAGNGSTANLQQVVGFEDVDAVVLSHRHIDHCIDLVGMFYALRFSPSFSGPIPLYAPDEVFDTLTGLLSADSAHAFADVFEHRLVVGGDRVRIGDIDATFHTARHPVPAVSVRLEHDDAVLAYSGDTAGDDELTACARDAHVFLCEATWQGDAGDYPQGIHLVARDAGRLAQQAGVQRLLLTHIAGGLDVDVSCEQAAAEFDGPVDAVEDLQRWAIEERA